MDANTYIKPSEIHGLGLFAKRNIEKGEKIVQASNADLSRWQDEWIIYLKNNKERSMGLVKGCCMINHSEKHNCVRDVDFSIIASRKIKEGEEITEDYYALPDNENPFTNPVDQFFFQLAELLR